jgi:hypothetical protein
VKDWRVHEVQRERAAAIQRIGVAQRSSMGEKVPEIAANPTMFMAKTTARK